MGRKGIGNLCRAVTAQLGRRIVRGEIPPGATLPTELAMATELGVSRTTVREAMKRLNGKGVVYGGPRHGMRVQPPAEWNQFDSELLVWRMESGESDALIDQLYEIRNCFEPRACAIAAERASEADRRAIVAHYEAMQRASSNAAACVAADLEFHLAIFAATRISFSSRSVHRSQLRCAWRSG
jgi:DNA-binding FadR family transcriptional regulator